jgi:hypothetical protein
MTTDLGDHAKPVRRVFYVAPRCDIGTVGYHLADDVQPYLQAHMGGCQQSAVTWCVRTSRTTDPSAESLGPRLIQRFADSSAMRAPCSYISAEVPA